MAPVAISSFLSTTIQFPLHAFCVALKLVGRRFPDSFQIHGDHKHFNY